MRTPKSPNSRPKRQKPKNSYYITVPAIRYRGIDDYYYTEPQALQLLDSFNNHPVTPDQARSLYELAKYYRSEHLYRFPVKGESNYKGESN